jgi:hypothetical protein
MFGPTDRIACGNRRPNGSGQCFVRDVEPNCFRLRRLLVRLRHPVMGNGLRLMT